MKAPLKDGLVTFREFLTEFHHTGTFLPSSRWAARALTNQLRRERAPIAILEVGSGTGAVTERILRDMIDGDELTVCEINPRFMKSLREKLRKNENFRRHEARVKFFEGPVQDMPEDKRFDSMICGLPFLNFNPSIVRSIFEKLERLSKPEASLSYFEHSGLRRIGKHMPPSQWQKRLHDIDKYFRELYAAREVRKSYIWRNYVPITVYTLKLPGKNGSY